MTTQRLKYSDANANHTQPWRIPDVIDFEYLLTKDASAEDEMASSRAREIFQEKTLPALREAGIVSRPVVFRSWLEVHRDAGGQQLPGELFRAAWQTLLVLCIVAGFGVGGSITGALLFYRGDVPVNVPWFLACTIGVQLLVLIAAAVLWVLRRSTSLFDDFRPLRSLLAGLVWAMSAGLRKLRGEQRTRLQAILAKIARRREIYGSLATWPFVVITQVFAVCFNLGILAVLLAHLAFTDINFGWQSSFVRSPEAAYRIASGMAAPWRFAPNANPMLQEVIDSRFEFTEKLPRSASAGKSWWPFLCYSVAFYGLLLRGALLVFAFANWRGALRKLAFDHEGCFSHYRWLIGSVVHSGISTTALVIPAGVAAPRNRASGGDTFALIAADLDISEDRIASYIHSKFGWRIAATHLAEIDHPSGNSDVLSALASAADCLASVIVIVPAKQAPIKAIAIFLQKVAKAAGAKPELILLLVGRQVNEGFAPVDKEDVTHWQKFADINRLHVSLEEWSSP
jgi:hypothetical protein